MAEEKKVTVKSTGDSNLFGALCYIIGVLVPLFVLFTDKKEDKFLAFHAWQSLFYTVVAFVLVFGLGVVTSVLAMVSGVGALLGCLIMPLYGVLILFSLFVAYKAYTGEKYKMPIIGDMAEKRA